MYTPINHELVVQVRHELIPNIVDRLPQGDDPLDQQHHYEPPTKRQANFFFY